METITDQARYDSIYQSLKYAVEHPYVLEEK